MNMRVPVSLRATGFGLVTLVAALTGAASAPAYATDYFALDLRHAEFAPEPLGPAAQFAPSSPAALPVATVREAAPSTQTVAATSRRVRVSHVREAARRPHRNPLNAFASYRRSRNGACTATSICVFDGARGLWHAR
jgi:hypothetical protein